MNSPSQHIDPETLAAFAEGRLDAAKRDAVVAHIDHCHDCMNDVALVMSSATAESQRRRFGRPSWLLALAAALALALPLAWHAMRHGSPTDELVSLSPRSARIVEPRLTGFPWAAYHGPMRAAGGSVTDAERLKLGGAAGELMQRAEHDSSAEAQHAAGVAMVLVDKPDEAIAKLESAAKASHDAKSWSDLAAARYAAAVQFRRPSLYPEALAASDDALRIDARLPEALFNRALILENMGLIAEARKAWQRYLEVDPGSQWSNEARTHLNELPSTTGASRWERDQPLLEAAAASGDARKTLALVDAHRERARRFAEAEYLGRWADAVQHNNDAEAAKWLTISRAIGNALAQLSGESLLRDAVHSIDTADTTTRAKMAEAHVIYRRGRIAFSHQQAESGERDLRQAAALFESAADPMSLIARHYAASARLAREDNAVAASDLERLRIATDAHPGYLVLGAHVRWELARARAKREDRSSQITTLADAATMFRRAGEHASEAFAEVAQATALSYLGRPDEAWSARGEAFRALSLEAQSDLIETALAAAVHDELRSGRRTAALALLRVAQAVQGPNTSPLLAIDTLVQKAMLESASGDAAEGARTTQQAEMIAGRLPDLDLRNRELVDIEVARGACLMASNPRNAEGSFTRAIHYYQAHGRTNNLPEPLLLRARCSLRMGRIAAAAQDLEEGVGVIEHQPVRVEGAAIGTGVLDAGNALFAEAIRLHLDSGEIAKAFGYAERARGGAGVTSTELQVRLGDSGAVVLEIVALPSEVVTFALSRNDMEAARRPRTAVDVAAIADRSIAGDEHACIELYDELIRPLSRVVDGAGSLIVVSDPILSRVPFAALLDSSTGRRLVERVSISIAPSGNSLRAAPSRRLLSLAGIALPSRDEAAQLPETDKELAEIAALYPRATTIPAARATWSAFQAAAASADVVHIAGHTERQAGEGEEALLFAGPRGDTVDRVSWKTVLSTHTLQSQVVVLAACETLRLPASSQTRALSLGAAFSDSGADVIGTLMPIADRDAHALFRAVHRRLAAGLSAAEALRAVQIEAIHDSDGNSTSAWRALAVLTQRIPKSNGDQNVRTVPTTDLVPRRLHAFS
jgi:tetratricopeptide (TPR) repeat protein